MRKLKTFIRINIPYFTLKFVHLNCITFKTLFFLVFLKSISLLNYKNIIDLQYTFDTKINSFVGKNGVGKTNVLDAIYHLAYGKSYFNPLASQNIKHG